MVQRALGMGLPELRRGWTRYCTDCGKPYPATGDFKTAYMVHELSGECRDEAYESVISALPGTKIDRDKFCRRHGERIYAQITVGCRKCRARVLFPWMTIHLLASAGLTLSAAFNWQFGMNLILPIVPSAFFLVLGFDGLTRFMSLGKWRKP